MEFFTYLEQILQLRGTNQKIKEFHKFYKSYISGQIEFDHSCDSIIFIEPSYVDVCNIVDAKTLPKRSNLSSIRGKAYLTHSIAHIEYSAIDLALDTAYRFKNMPEHFYDDWLEVANDEIRHFEMLESLLVQNGYKYGDFDVHSFLFDTSMRCLDIVDRIAVVPRYLEASGLDSSPKVLAKLRNIKDEFSTDLQQAISIILDEEIDHVRKGDYWFKYLCTEKNINPDSYFDIVENILAGASRKKPYVNVKARLQAGFSKAEIAVLSR